VARFVASEYGCADWAVRNAISAALEAKLAKRRHELSIVFEIPRLFTAPVELGGHQACKIRLTPLGELWEASQPRAGDAEPVGADIGRELLAEGCRIARRTVPPGQAPPAAGISDEEQARRGRAGAEDAAHLPRDARGMLVMNSPPVSREGP
jgi:hypothetical protein